MARSRSYKTEGETVAKTEQCEFLEQRIEDDDRFGIRGLWPSRSLCPFEVPDQFSAL